jgi:hypothetical protein
MNMGLAKTTGDGMGCPEIGSNQMLTIQSLQNSIHNNADTPQAPSPRVDRSRPKLSDAYWSSTQNADATTLRTCKVDDISLSILTVAMPGDPGLSHL